MDRINADSLRTFLEVARVEHLGRASESLQADPSTVSRKIARLEQEIGVPLFERIGRSIRLTQAGKRFVGRAERLLSDLREAVADAEGAVSAESGEVRVGFLHTVGARWLPQKLARFLQAHPGVRFILEEGTTAEVASGVLAGDFDLGILGPPPVNTPDLETVPLFRERVAVVVPVGHHLSGRTSAALSDLADEPLILPRSRSGLRKIIDDAFAAQGLTTKVAYEGNDFSIVQGLVEAGLGITLMPMPLPSASGRVNVIPLRDPPIARTMALVWDRRRTLPPAALLFSRELVGEVADPYEPPPGG
ncbi:MAG: LysR substrate-binding domain-containing protein [Candidatus Dormibacteraeota bacterium]|nr:LysR substrate-binding domain-containing protein [Candidatus Dormibacteraeota bacterium]